MKEKGVIKEEKLKKLKNILKEMGSVLVAYSGGVDSSFLLKTARDVLGEAAVAVTALSPVYPRKEAEEAKQIARELGVKHLLIKTNELENPDFCRNSPRRCYYCKKELFSRLKKLAQENKLNWVVDGSNVDDTGDFRPGIQAMRELGVRSPLQEAGLTKIEIRELSRNMGLTTWEKPSFACLASRFPYGLRIKENDLKKVDEGENFLRELGFSQVRVRHYQHTVRLEVEQNKLLQLLEKNIREKIIKKFKQLGYTYVTVDLEGYRTGSMNEVLK